MPFFFWKSPLSFSKLKSKFSFLWRAFTSCWPHWKVLTQTIVNCSDTVLLAPSPIKPTAVVNSLGWHRRHIILKSCWASGAGLKRKVFLKVQVNFKKKFILSFYYFIISYLASEDVSGKDWDGRLSSFCFSSLIANLDSGKTQIWENDSANRFLKSALRLQILIQLG